MNSPKTERHNIRMPRGKRRGQFVKKKVLLRSEKVVQTNVKRALKEVSLFEKF